MSCARSPRLIATLAIGIALAANGFFPRAATAECACLWEGSFADVYKNADVVVAARVTKAKGNAADIFIEETLSGDAYIPDIRVWMKTQDYCRPSIEEFPVGSRWIMALHKIREVPEGGFDPGTPNQSFGRVDDYYLRSCGGYWLSNSGEAVTGNLIDAPRWARDPDMTPVLLDVLRAFVSGKTDRDALLQASQEDPALLELMLDTKAFLRGDPEKDQH